MSNRDHLALPVKSEGHDEERPSCKRLQYTCLRCAACSAAKMTGICTLDAAAGVKDQAPVREA